ncbi:MAG: ABC transporter ATP-binding protein [Solirubrobacterales bacterium]
MLQLQNVSLNIGENGDQKEILKDINLTFEKGKLYAITGPNGGGKTSIAKTIMGIYQPSAGHILLEGQNITDLSITERARKGIAYAFQQPPRFKGILIDDMMKIARTDMEALELRSILRDVGLCPEDYTGRDMGPGLSGGEIKRIEVAQVLARAALISIYDEPEAGVDLWTIQKLGSLIVRKHKEHPDRTTIVITHNEQFLPLCDEIILVAGGQIEQKGPAAEIWPMIKDEIICKLRDQCGGVVPHATQSIR